MNVRSRGVAGYRTGTTAFSVRYPQRARRGTGSPAPGALPLPARAPSARGGNNVALEFRRVPLNPADELQLVSRLRQGLSVLRDGNEHIPAISKFRTYSNLNGSLCISSRVGQDVEQEPVGVGAVMRRASHLIYIHEL